MIHGDQMDANGRALPESPCPRCGYVLNASADARGRPHRPSPGDWTVCIRCSAASVFGDDMRLREPTDAENAALWQDADLRRSMQIAQTTVQQFHARGN